MSLQLLQSLDIKMLKTLTVLISTENVSKTADHLDIQQSTVSYQLSKLREALNDPILIRSGRGFEASPYAKAIHAPLNAHLQSLELLLFKSQFLPYKAQGKVRMACHRNGSKRLIKAIIDKVKTKMPMVALDIIDWNEKVTDQLRNAELDFAIGFEPEELNQLNAVSIAKLNYQLVMAPNHPLASQTPSLNNVFDYPHVRLATHDSIERWLDYSASKRSKIRTVCFSSASMEFATMAVEESNRLLFVANTRDNFFNGYDVITMPIDFVAPQTVSLMFHQRATIDPLLTYTNKLIQNEACAVFESSNESLTT
ncbi:LysR family transcriptional regulator [Vibrio sonorensis]|uniref:LysR family transcriptional regulator n=1 Tax=Vibrio sonorensis TaxID=1004316 RepID=UPI0008D8DE06|nr:LysR family transcriptional regulator [Vibrio sonorensis]